MFKYEANFQKIEALRKKHPNKTLKELFEQSGVDQSSYYVGRNAALSAKITKPISKSRQYAQIQAPEAAPAPAPPERKSDRLVFMMGTPEQIKAVLAGGAL